jgi:endonuclease/exonuclease/phosphatase family metal-dependent hydrolase
MSFIKKGPDMAENKVKLMTYNLGGGRKNLGSNFSDILRVIKKENPDILAIQEGGKWKLLDKKEVDQIKAIAEDGINSKYYFFGPTLTMKENFHIKKELFVHGIFNDWENWQQGNALFSRWPFTRLGDSKKPGTPYNIPLYKVSYEGNRDTDPRYIILAQIDMGFAKVFTLVTHLTTLYGERGDREIHKKGEESQKLRWEQCERILDLTREYILERDQLAFLMGDLNATFSEPAISTTLEKKGGFIRLLPFNNLSTHLKVDLPVDHIFIFPGKYHIKYDCKIYDDGFSASDHNPVVADITIFDADTEAYKKQGKGVFQEKSR